MNPQTNKTLEAVRTKLQAELEGSNVTNASLTEEEKVFVEEAFNLAKSAGYELEGFGENVEVAAVVEALQAVAEEEGGEIADAANKLVQRVSA